ncbi:TetR family transcriptional regulator C-terminal domain-containing protein [Saccharopolyspora sp. WRP15-2]|uniref:TetR family transcriptional regulator C-terminal domain-containing protein n=1 Tax=Saccharopolyspora oryzae TaxID=2997343 RepID=A0ABT4V6M4_9PSEU|nr:TetR family transcriptional regulator C-terminal domain-containing protein [Saccharopolyspora oryzae]MDA3629071.1 TetR family transcriptional regulator C-terminal domain-containing protein [Saccharopolyspora oryzae]
MPKIVDHQARRLRIAEALWQVALRDGIHAVSVRTVATQAQTSPTALRYFFTTQDELMEFAMRAVADRVAVRVRARLEKVENPDGVRRLLEELIPLDADRRLEQGVYLAFLVRAQTHPGLRAVAEEVESQLAGLVRQVVGFLRAAGGLGEGRSIDRAARSTYALLDGLAFQGALWPDRHPPKKLKQILRDHLAELATASVES